MPIPWIPLLTAGLTFAGGLLGNNTNTQQNTNTNSTTTGVTGQTSQQTGTTNQTQTGTQTQTSTDRGSGSTAETVNRLDSRTQSQLTAAVQRMLQSSGSGSAALQAELASLSNPSNRFDADGFVQGIMESAKVNAGDAFGSGTNNIRSRIGANSGTNSAAALLESKLARDTSANLAGIESQARGQAAQIQQNEVSTRAGALTNLTGGMQNEMQGLLSSLLQATQTSTGTSQTSNTGTTAGRTTQTGTETSDVRQNTAGTSTQDTRERSATGQDTTQRDWTQILSGLSDMFSAGF